MKSNQKIEKLNEDCFILKKDKEFQCVFDVTLAIYNKFIQDIEKIIKKKYPEKNSFVELIIILKNEKKNILLNKEQLELLSNWIDSICNILLEKEGVDLKNKELTDYFKLASEFNKEASSLMSEKNK